MGGGRAGRGFEEGRGQKWAAAREVGRTQARGGDGGFPVLVVMVREEGGGWEEEEREEEEEDLIDLAPLRLVLVLDDGDLVLEGRGVLGRDFQAQGQVVRHVGLVHQVDQRRHEAGNAQDLPRKAERAVLRKAERAVVRKAERAVVRPGQRAVSAARIAWHARPTGSSCRLDACSEAAAPFSLWKEEYLTSSPSRGSGLSEIGITVILET